MSALFEFLAPCPHNAWGPNSPGCRCLTPRALVVNNLNHRKEHEWIGYDDHQSESNVGGVHEPGRRVQAVHVLREVRSDGAASDVVVQIQGHEVRERVVDQCHQRYADGVHEQEGGRGRQGAADGQDKAARKWVRTPKRMRVTSMCATRKCGQGGGVNGGPDVQSSKPANMQFAIGVGRRTKRMGGGGKGGAETQSSRMGCLRASRDRSR